MKQLAAELKHKGVPLRLVKREKAVAMYAVGKCGAVEVIKIGHSPDRDVVMDGVTVHYEECETYPSTEQFGSRGWYYMPQQRELAEKKYNQLIST